MKYGNALVFLTDLTFHQSFSDGLYFIQEREYHVVTPKITKLYSAGLSVSQNTQACHVKFIGRSVPSYSTMVRGSQKLNMRSLWHCTTHSINQRQFFKHLYHFCPERWHDFLLWYWFYFWQLFYFVSYFLFLSEYFGCRNASQHPQMPFSAEIQAWYAYCQRWHPLTRNIYADIWARPELWTYLILKNTLA